MKLAKKIALITGGTKGIGKAIAQRFIKEGAEVIIFDLEKPDFNAKFFKVDISKEEEIKKAFKDIKVVDILINNAGVYYLSSVESTSKKELDHVIDVNYKGTYLMCKHALPFIKKNKGSIINISSGLGIVPEPESPAYCSSKAAIIMLTKCLAQDLASKSVRVNAILPGPIDTPLLRNAFSDKKIKEYAKTNPMKRIGKPEEVANVALFLASNEASFVTGGMYSVDGGESSSSLYSK